MRVFVSTGALGWVSVEKAKKHGHQILNGEKMFLYQAQKAFKLWHNISPKIDNILIDYLKND